MDKGFCYREARILLMKLNLREDWWANWGLSQRDWGCTNVYLRDWGHFLFIKPNEPQTSFLQAAGVTRAAFLRPHPLRGPPSAPRQGAPPPRGHPSAGRGGGAGGERSESRARPPRVTCPEGGRWWREALP